MGIQQQQQEEVVVMGANKKRRRPPSSHNEEDQQGAAADDLNLKKKKTKKLLPVPWSIEEIPKLAAALPGVVTEYTAEDAARFDEDMARTDKILDEFYARIASFHPATSCEDPVVPYNGLQHEIERAKEEKEMVLLGGRRWASKAEIKKLRSIISGGYHPLPDRLLCDRTLFPEADAEQYRKEDRLISKVYAWMQDGIRELIHRYDADTAAAAAAAKGINPSTSSIDPSAMHD